MIYKSFAQGAGAAQAYSQNVVGYTKIKLTGSLSMMGASFKEVNGNNTKVHISKIIPSDDIAGIDWNRGVPRASLQIWNGSSYVGGTYFWTGEVPILDQIDQKEEHGLDPSFVYNKIWVDNRFYPVDVSFPSGTAFWLRDDTQNTMSSATITVLGEVLKNDDATIPTPTVTPLTMIANTLPVAVNINDLVLSGIAGIDWDKGVPKASLKIWNGSSYVGGTYFWTGEVPIEDQIDQKDEHGLDPSFVYNNIWVDNRFCPVDVFIEIGQGVWIDNPTASGSSSVAFPAVLGL